MSTRIKPAIERMRADLQFCREAMEEVLRADRGSRAKMEEAIRRAKAWERPEQERIA